jgi:hypothetical protein
LSTVFQPVAQGRRVKAGLWLLVPCKFIAIKQRAIQLVNFNSLILHSGSLQGMPRQHSKTHFCKLNNSTLLLTNSALDPEVRFIKLQVFQLRWPVAIRRSLSAFEPRPHAFPLASFPASREIAVKRNRSVVYFCGLCYVLSSGVISRHRTD